MFIDSVHVQASNGTTNEPMGENQVQKTSIADIPRDRMVDIFSRLSAADIATMRRVCQEWRDIIENQHGTKVFAHSGALYNLDLTTDITNIPDDEMKETIAFHIKQSGFAPVGNDNLGPDFYPKDSRPIMVSDLASHPDVVSAWFTTLFGKQDAQPEGAIERMMAWTSSLLPKPEIQEEHALSYVAAVLPRIQVREVMREADFEHMTFYIEKLCKNTRFMGFVGPVTAQKEDALRNTSHTLVARADDLKAHKDTLKTLLDTRDDHHVVFCFDSDAFIDNGTLTLEREDMPKKLKHHLTLVDPFKKVRRILWEPPSLELAFPPIHWLNEDIFKDPDE
ncbi:MAG: hypothetical protein C0514_05285 [Candidatus Puniceispirillum sp.]|nr:hypothetical protein [Candidatus Puniceispirillum sp.]